MISLVSIRDCKRKKEKVRMKKKALLTIGIIFSMVITSFNMNFENVDADETEASEQYIVSTKNGELFKDIQTKYGDCISDEAEKAESLEEHNTTVLELSEKEAQQLEKKQGITIEPDCEMEGLGETEDNITDVSEWNMQMINADENSEKSKDKIKVAIIDSGVDYTNGIKVAERYNLVPGEEDINIIYEDRTGHGTAVAAIIAANSKDKDGISGIAPDNVELYSVKALDCENKAPLSRIVDGIYWAVDKGVNIINLSLGTKTNADILEQAIKYGLKVVKFFPAEAAGGIKTIKAMAAPYHQMKFMPTGGVNLDNINEYLNFDKIIACGGTWMVKDNLIKEKKFDEIQNLTTQAVHKMLGFKLAHIGINCDNEEQAHKVAEAFDFMFGFAPKENPSSIFSDTYVETMKTPFLGTKGHIAIAVNSVERAKAYLEQKNIAFNEDSAVYRPDGKMQAVYMAQEVGGFAIHLVRNPALS